MRKNGLRFGSLLFASLWTLAPNGILRGDTNLAGTVTVNGNLTVTTNLTVGQALSVGNTPLFLADNPQATVISPLSFAILANGNVYGHIGLATPPGEDTGFLMLNGGGGNIDPSRGAYLWLGGNQCSNFFGQLWLGAGNVAGGDIFIATSNAVPRLIVRRNGQIDFCGNRGTNLADPVSYSDAATRGWVENQITGDILLATNDLATWTSNLVATTASQIGSGDFTVGGCLYVNGSSVIGTGSASGLYSLAIGYASATGYGSFAQGGMGGSWGDPTLVTASGNNSVAEGWGTTASGDNSHAEGTFATASGYCSHAEGDHTTASTYMTHAEGQNSAANGWISHAEGESTTAGGGVSHAEGQWTIANGWISHAEGGYTTADGDLSHAEGWYTTADGYLSHAEGEGTTASGQHGAHAEGYETTALGDYCWYGAHAEGYGTIANGFAPHAEGGGAIADGNSAHAEGDWTVANGAISPHAEGSGTVASGYIASHAEGEGTLASGSASHAEGELTTAAGFASHAAGENAFADHDNSYVWSDGTETHSAQTQTFTVCAGNGVLLMSGTNTFELSGIGDSGGASVNGSPLISSGNVAHVLSGQTLNGLTLEGATLDDATLHFATLSAPTISDARFSSDLTFSNGVTFSGCVNFNGTAYYYKYVDGSDGNEVANVNNVKDGVADAKSYCDGCCGTLEDEIKKLPKDDVDTLDSVTTGEGNNQTENGIILGSGSAESSSLCIGSGSAATTALSVGSAIADGDNSIACGTKTTEAGGVSSFAEGNGSRATGDDSHAEGFCSHAYGPASHAEGSCTEVDSEAAHVEGACAVATGSFAHAEGLNTTANGFASHAAGEFADAENDNSYVWSDGTQTTSPDTQTYTVCAANGTHLQGGAFVTPLGDLQMGAFTQGTQP